MRLIILIIGIGLQPLYSQQRLITAKQGFGVSQNKQAHALFDIEFHEQQVWGIVGQSTLLLTSTDNNQRAFSTGMILNRHFFFKNHDFYVGLGAGTVGQRAVKDMQPKVNTVVGYNYYANKYFHFFLKLNYDYYQSPIVDVMQSPGVEVYFGLGYQLNDFYRLIRGK
mgnify:CR=1 FL=1